MSDRVVLLHLGWNNRSYWFQGPVGVLVARGNHPVESGQQVRPGLGTRQDQQSLVDQAGWPLNWAIESELTRLDLSAKIQMRQRSTYMSALPELRPHRCPCNCLSVFQNRLVCGCASPTPRWDWDRGKSISSSARYDVTRNRSSSTPPPAAAPTSCLNSTQLAQWRISPRPKHPLLVTRMQVT